jgi:hypothetical protein
MPEMKKASDFKCCKCKKAQAVVFWPVCDPDIPSHPYCRKCVDKVHIELLVQIADINDSFRKVK